MKTTDLYTIVEAYKELGYTQEVTVVGHGAPLGDMIVLQHPEHTATVSIMFNGDRCRDIIHGGILDRRDYRLARTIRYNPNRYSPIDVFGPPDAVDQVWSHWQDRDGRIYRLIQNSSGFYWAKKVSDGHGPSN